MILSESQKKPKGVNNGRKITRLSKKILKAFLSSPLQVKIYDMECSPAEFSKVIFEIKKSLEGMQFNTSSQSNLPYLTSAQISSLVSNQEFISDQEKLNACIHVTKHEYSIVLSEKLIYIGGVSLIMLLIVFIITLGIHHKKGAKMKDLLKSSQISEKRGSSSLDPSNTQGNHSDQLININLSLDGQSNRNVQNSIEENIASSVTSQGEIKSLHDDKRLDNDQVNITESKVYQWHILSESITGKGHLRCNPPLPCQDYYKVENIDALWGVAVVCDGMGSKLHPEVGAKFVAEYTANSLRTEVEKQKWILEDCLPTEFEWKEIALKVLYSTYRALNDFADEKQYPLKELACTVIATVYSPFGLMTTHIGDGRAGYCTNDGQWFSMMTPHKGEEANATYPITANIWQSPEFASQFIESRVINSPVKAFCMMSDGCESFAYETSRWDENEQMCIQINKPAPVFFDPVLKYIYKAYESDERFSEEWETKIRSSWTELLTVGTLRIANEPDDKTLVLGILINDKVKGQ